MRPADALRQAATFARAKSLVDLVRREAATLVRAKKLMALAADDMALGYEASEAATRYKERYPNVVEDDKEEEEEKKKKNG